MVKRLPFDDVFRDESGGNIKTLQSDYLSFGQFPIVDQGKDLVGGYTDDFSKLCKSDLPVIVFGDHTKCVKLVDFRFAMGADGVKVLRPKIDADLKYLFYYLQSLRITDAGYSRHFKFLRRTEIPLPPLEEQKRIADVLDRSDALRQKRRLAILKLDTLLQSVFLDMFGDPVKNPKGWERVSFDDVCKTRLGKMLDQKKFTGNNLRPYLRNANVQWNRFDLTNVDEMDFDEREREILRLQYGDLLICEGGEVGRTAIWRNELPECYYQKALHKGRPDLNRATSEYLMFLMWFFSKQGGFKDFVTSVTIAHLTGEKLKTIKIPLPPIDLQEKFSRFVIEHSRIKKKYEKLQREVDGLFVSSQHRAFKGELFKSAVPSVGFEPEKRLGPTF
jgi:type I restriction enzyme, S subunit